MLKTLTFVSVLFVAANGDFINVPDFGPNPANVRMDIYRPAKVAANPGVIVALHGCSQSGAAYMAATKYPALADVNGGFVVIYPSSPHSDQSGCWDVASTKSLTRDGGGDSTSIANMVKSAITTFNADPKKVFVTGSSSGGMMTGVMAATYPDMFAAASIYSGAPAGCLAGSTGFSPGSGSQDCANGKVIKTQTQWVSQVQAMDPGYNGPRPKMQIMHGTADSFVNYFQNFEEQIKEWSGVLGGVSFNKNNTDTPESGYTQLTFGDGTKLVAYSAAGVGHTVPVHEKVDLAWFGIA